MALGCTAKALADSQRQDSDGDDSFDPNSLTVDRWLSRKEVFQWKAGVHPDQLSRLQKQADASEQVRVMQKQRDISNSMVSFKHDREDKSSCINVSNQIKLMSHQNKMMDYQLDRRYRIALLIAQLIFILFLCVLLFFYVMPLFEAGHYYTALGFMIFILLFASRLIYNS